MSAPAGMPVRVKRPFTSVVVMTIGSPEYRLSQRSHDAPVTIGPTGALGMYTVALYSGRVPAGMVTTPVSEVVPSPVGAQLGIRHFRLTQLGPPPSSPGVPLSRRSGCSSPIGMPWMAALHAGPDTSPSPSRASAVVGEGFDRDIVVLFPGATGAGVRRRP